MSSQEATQQKLQRNQLLRVRGGEQQCTERRGGESPPGPQAHHLSGLRLRTVIHALLACLPYVVKDIFQGCFTSPRCKRPVPAPSTGGRGPWLRCFSPCLSTRVMLRGTLEAEGPWIHRHRGTLILALLSSCFPSSVSLTDTLGVEEMN